MNYRLTASLPVVAMLVVGASLFAAIPAAHSQFLWSPPPAPDPPPLKAGTKAPDVLTKAINGKSLSLHSLRGKVVLVDFWATWCGPCRIATPFLESLHRKFAKTGLRVIGVSVDQKDSIRSVKPFIKHFGITYLVSASPDANQYAQMKYNATGVPSQYLIDKKGVVRWSQLGYSDDEKTELTALIKKLLKEKA